MLKVDTAEKRNRWRNDEWVTAPSVTRVPPSSLPFNPENLFPAVRSRGRYGKSSLGVHPAGLCPRLGKRLGCRDLTQFDGYRSISALSSFPRPGNTRLFF